MEKPKIVFVNFRKNKLPEILPETLISNSVTQKAYKELVREYPNYHVFENSIIGIWSKDFLTRPFSFFLPDDAQSIIAYGIQGGENDLFLIIDLKFSSLSESQNRVLLTLALNYKKKCFLITSDEIMNYDETERNFK